MPSISEIFVTAFRKPLETRVRVRLIQSYFAIEHRENLTLLWSLPRDAYMNSADYAVARDVRLSVCHIPVV